MAFSFSGNINGQVDSLPTDLPLKVENFSIVNKENSQIVFNIYKIGINSICVSPNNQVLAANAMYEGTRPFVVLATEVIRVESTGSVDYDFTIENMTP